MFEVYHAKTGLKVYAVVDVEYCTAMENNLTSPIIFSSQHNIYQQQAWHGGHAFILYDTNQDDYGLFFVWCDSFAFQHFSVKKQHFYRVWIPPFSATLRMLQFCINHTFRFPNHGVQVLSRIKYIYKEVKSDFQSCLLSFHQTLS